MCDDLDAFRERMAGLGVPCGEPTTERWGTITALTLPGGGTLGVYQPTHPSPPGSRVENTPSGAGCTRRGLYSRRGERHAGVRMPRGSNCCVPAEVPRSVQADPPVR